MVLQIILGAYAKRLKNVFVFFHWHFLLLGISNQISLSDGAGINPGDLRITGLTMTGTNAGYCYVGDTITCTGYSDPPPISYSWTQLETGQTFPGQSVMAISAGVSTLTCTASNIYSARVYTATSARLTLTARNRGSGGKASSEARACVGLVLATAAIHVLAPFS